MKKREFLKVSGIITAGAILAPTMACSSEKNNDQASNGKLASAVQGFELPALGYGFDALEPHIDARTMEIHHDKHHAGYVRKLNAALEGNDLAGKTLEEILAGIGPDDTAVRNNGGGHYNHSLFWEIMGPGNHEGPSGDLSDALNTAFGSFDQFKDTFSQAAKTRFGSGWAWLCVDNDKKLFITSTANQDNPMMTGIAEQTGKPILGIDVWEHAYYLKYQNRRPDYVKAWFNTVDWNKVAQRM
jgi:Fe-Mn family superoxide dismutase